MFSVVTDSTAYLTRKEAEKLDIHVLPMSYSVGILQLGEGYIEESGRYTELIASNLNRLHTSQVSMGAFLGAFNELIRDDKEVLCITISSRLSGTYVNALMASRQMAAGKIQVVDSLSTVAGMRYLVKRACELSQEGASLEHAVKELESMRSKIGIVFSVDDMEALRRSGRLGFVRQSVGTILNIRPILFCQNGTIVSGGVARGTRGQIESIVGSIPSEVKHIEIHHILNKPIVDKLEKEIRSKFSCPIHKSKVGPTISIHIGLSAVGVAWLC